MQKYPDGSFEYEYGQSEFLYRWAGSPMWEKYIKSISDDIGLLVTVPSHMPYLYFDYGFWGGIVMWAILCFIIESIATRLRNRNSIINVFLFMLITRLFFATPISSCFMGLIPAFEWLIILYFSEIACSPIIKNNTNNRLNLKSICCNLTCYKDEFL